MTAYRRCRRWIAKRRTERAADDAPGTFWYGTPRPPIGWNETT